MHATVNTEIINQTITMPLLYIGKMFNGTNNQIYTNYIICISSYYATSHIVSFTLNSTTVGSGD